MNFPDMQLTNYGIAAILASLYAQSPLTFTGVMLGDGALPSGADVKEMTALVSPKVTVGLQSCTVSEQVATLVFTLSLASVSAAFDLRELGIMATVNAGEENEQSILYAYTNAGSNAIRVIPDTSGNHAQISFTVHVAVGDAEEVTAIISDVTGYVTQDDFDAHLRDHNNPHHVTKADVGLGNVVNAAPSDMTINFTQAGKLTVPVTGSELSELMGLLSKAIKTLSDHLTQSNNPHSVTLAQIGAASAGHRHHALDIVAGVLPIARGGTGQTTDAGIASMLAATPAETRAYLGIGG